MFDGLDLGVGVLKRINSHRFEVDSMILGN